MNDIVDGKLVFTNCKPSVYDGLGEIAWELTQDQSICKNCGPVKLEDIKLVSMFYDGCNWENPSCPNCGRIIAKALPVNPSEREIIVGQRNEIARVLNVGAVKGGEQ